MLFRSWQPIRLPSAPRRGEPARHPTVLLFSLTQTFLSFLPELQITSNLIHSALYQKAAKISSAIVFFPHPGIKFTNPPFLLLCFGRRKSCVTHKTQQIIHSQAVRLLPVSFAMPKISRKPSPTHLKCNQKIYD